MKKGLILAILFMGGLGISQEMVAPFFIEELEVNEGNDSYNGVKTTDYNTQRSYPTSLDKKYNDKEFTYTVEDIKEPEKEEVPDKNIQANSKFLEGFIGFMSIVFPYLFGLLVVYIIVKAVMGSEANFWRRSKTYKIKTNSLPFEEEIANISETDFNALLKRAFEKGDYRLATRYYYLSLLKVLAEKEHNIYHKEKTNAAYIFELENKLLRERFSYLSYIYNYVWYGEFEVDIKLFKQIELDYKSCINTIN